MRRIAAVISIIIASLCLAASASAFVVSHASSGSVQAQPRPFSCHVQGQFPFTEPDLRCTPGALNPAVRQATIHRTICVSGYTSRIRPSSYITGKEKLASIRAYGFHQGPSAYEYDHLISLELGGAANDPRNLWPENGASPNLKDKVENALHRAVCSGQMSLGSAQRIIALDWVSYYKQHLAAPAPPPPPPPPPAAPAPSTSSGATGQCNDGTPTYAVHHQGACSSHGGVAFWF